MVACFPRTMLAAVTATAPSASETLGTQHSPLRASFLENMQSRVPWPNFNHLIDTTGLANMNTFSVGEKGPSASGKGKTKPTVTKAERPRRRLSSVSSATLSSEPVDELYHAPWRKEIYEALANLMRRHTELIEQQISHNTTNNRPTRDIDQVGGHVRQMLTSQKSTEKRLSAYDTLQKKCTDSELSV